MNNKQIEILGELRGFLHAFEWMNQKTNNGYSFEIVAIPKPSKSISDIIKKHFSVLEPIDISHEAVRDWNKLLRFTFDKWLFECVKHYPGSASLSDKTRSFEVSRERCRKEIIDGLIQKIDVFGPIQEAHCIQIQGEAFFACAYDLILLDCKDTCLFFHFDVCD